MLVPWNGMIRTLLTVGMVVGVPLAVAAQGTENGEWRSYGGDIANTRYSPLDQIAAENFGDLEVAWAGQDHELRTQPRVQL